MADNDSPKHETKCDLERELAQTAYECQFAKIGELDEYALQVSGFVVTITLGSYAFAPENMLVAGGMGVVVFGVNCLAIAYIWRVMWSQDNHEELANKLLEKYAPDVDAIIRNYSRQSDEQNKVARHSERTVGNCPGASGARVQGFTRWRPRFQIWMHFMLVLASAVFCYLAFTGLLTNAEKTTDKNTAQAVEPESDRITPPSTTASASTPTARLRVDG